VHLRPIDKELDKVGTPVAPGAGVGQRPVELGAITGMADSDAALLGDWLEHGGERRPVSTGTGLPNVIDQRMGGTAIPADTRARFWSSLSLCGNQDRALSLRRPPSADRTLRRKPAAPM
jgi:hypothetical protein